MNGRAIPGAYLFRLYVCDKEMSWPHHMGETHQPDWVVYVRDSFYRNLQEITFRLTNVIPERIIFVSRGITVMCTVGSAVNVWVFAALLNHINVEVSFLLGCGASSRDYWFLTFRDSMVVSSSGVEMYWMLEDKRTTLPWNMGSYYSVVQWYVPET